MPGYQKRVYARLQRAMGFRCGNGTRRASTKIQQGLGLRLGANALTKSPAVSGNTAGMVRRSSGSVLRGRFRARAVAPLGHELVELGLVLGHAQPAEKLMEFLLL